MNPEKVRRRLRRERLRDLAANPPDWVALPHFDHDEYAAEVRALQGAIQRCYNRNSTAYKYYGARGIEVCTDWMMPRGIDLFILHIGKKPSPAHSIDRIDNDGNYEPGNVRWATWEQQAGNRRPAGSVPEYVDPYRQKLIDKQLKRDERRRLDAEEMARLDALEAAEIGAPGVAS